jgi:hypothetical protein
MMPETKAQIKLLPELELLMDNGDTLNLKLGRRDHSRPFKVRQRDTYNIRQVS